MNTTDLSNFYVFPSNKQSENKEKHLLDLIKILYAKNHPKLTINDRVSRSNEPSENMQPCEVVGQVPLNMAPTSGMPRL